MAIACESMRERVKDRKFKRTEQRFCSFILNHAKVTLLCMFSRPWTRKDGCTYCKPFWLQASQNSFLTFWIKLLQLRTHPALPRSLSEFYFCYFLRPRFDFPRKIKFGRKVYLGTWHMQTIRTPKWWAEFNLMNLAPRTYYPFSSYWREPDPRLVEQLFLFLCVGPIFNRTGPETGILR